MVDFFDEKQFDKEQYEAYLRRIHYDDRDAANYENMLKFLWHYVITPDLVKDREGLLEEYGHWNLMLVDKCFYHMPHNLPYANIRRAYQSFIHLLDGQIGEGLLQLDRIGVESFSNDGKAPRMMMDQRGRVFYPMSRLFLLYNYDKVMAWRGMEEERNAFREKYKFAFTKFEDGEHDDHDAYLTLSMDAEKDVIFYPVFERIYKQPWGPKDFYMYYDPAKKVPIGGPLFLKEEER